MKDSCGIELFLDLSKGDTGESDERKNNPQKYDKKNKKHS